MTVLTRPIKMHTCAAEESGRKLSITAEHERLFVELSTDTKDPGATTCFRITFNRLFKVLKKAEDDTGLYDGQAAASPVSDIKEATAPSGTSGRGIL